MTYFTQKDFKILPYALAECFWGEITQIREEEQDRTIEL